MQTLRVEDTDSRFEFAPDSAWKVQGSYHYSEAMFARFFILFRGQYQALRPFSSSSLNLEFKGLGSICMVNVGMVALNCG